MYFVQWMRAEEYACMHPAENHGSGKRVSDSLIECNLI